MSIIDQVKLTQRGDCGEKRLRPGLPAVNKEKNKRTCEFGWVSMGNLNFHLTRELQKLTFWAKTTVLMGRERTKRGPVGQWGKERTDQLLELWWGNREDGIEHQLTNTLDSKSVARLLHLECASRGTQRAHLAALRSECHFYWSET